MGGHRARALNRAAGSEYERRALVHLKEQGLLLVAENVRCRFGEIDLVMRDGHTLVVVEVRYRQDNSFANAAASVSFGKQQKIIRAANWFLGRHARLATLPLRFDVVAFDRDPKAASATGDGCRLQWLKDAFRPGSPY